MPKDIESTSKNLEKKLDLLIKRFDEQKGIIDTCLLYTSDAADE